MATLPTDELTDERLAAIEDRWTENNMIHGDIHTLIQEVRRLRGLVEDRGEAIARAGTAEAEVERLSKREQAWVKDGITLMERVEAKESKAKGWMERAYTAEARVRELTENYRLLSNNALARLEKAEAEVERLRKDRDICYESGRVWKAERDHYRGLLEAYSKHGPHGLSRDRALAALDQPVREEGEKE